MDRFDDIWKNRFNEEELPVGDWNSPDDDVWKGILAETVPKKKKRRLLWLWWNLGFVLVLLLSIFVIKNFTKETDKESISKADKFGTLINENKITTEEKNKTLTIGEEDGNSYLERKEKLINVSPSTNENNQKELVLSKEKNNTNTTNSKTSKGKIIPSTTSVSSKSEIDLKNSLSDFSNLVMNQEDGINNLRNEILFSRLPTAQVLLDLEQSFYPVSIFSKAIVDELVPPKFEKISIGIHTGVIFWKHRISDQYTSDLSAFEFIYESNWGWQSGLNVNVELGKYVDAFIGFQYEQIRTTSGHNSNLTYSLDDEVNPANPLNQYALSLATPYGLSGATFNFIRNQSLGTNEVNLLVDFHSSHLIKNLSIPVGTVIYPFGKKRKLIPSATLGLGINYLASISNSIQKIETHHNAIQFEDSGTSTFVAPTLEKWHFDFRIGIGLSYKFSPNLGINFNYNWSRGINPIYKFDNYKTRIDRHHLTLGVTKFL